MSFELHFFQEGNYVVNYILCKPQYYLDFITDLTGITAKVLETISLHMEAKLDIKAFVFHSRHLKKRGLNETQLK